MRFKKMFEYENKAWLLEQYINQKKTIEQIAEISKVSSSTIQNRLVKYNIPRRKLIGKNNPNWRGGISRYNENYKEKIGNAIGRTLKCDEIVHHIDNDGRNNILSNLFICKDYQHHVLIHKQIRRIAFELVKSGFIKFNPLEGKYYFKNLEGSE